jgi:hypothetical protein
LVERGCGGVNGQFEFFLHTHAEILRATPQIRTELNLARGQILRQSDAPFPLSHTRLRQSFGHICARMPSPSSWLKDTSDPQLLLPKAPPHPASFCYGKGNAERDEVLGSVHPFIVYWKHGRKGTCTCTCLNQTSMRLQHVMLGFYLLKFKQ